MLGRSILVSILVICVSAQDTSTDQMSRSSFLQDRGQSSWSSLPNYFDDIPHNERTIGSGSLFRDQGSLLQPDGFNDFADLESLNQDSSLFRNQDSILEPGGLPVIPYSLESSLSNGPRFIDTTMRGQGMLNGNSRVNRNDILSPRGLNLPNLQTSLSPMRQGLSGFPSDGLSSVLDGRSLGDDFSGFSTSSPWDRSRGARAQNTFPFQYSDSRNLNVPPMPMSQRQGMPRRLLNTQNSQSGMGQLGLNRGLAGRRGNGLGLNRLNMQRDMSAGQLNLLGDLGVSRPLNDMVTPSRRRLENNARRMDDIWVFGNGPEDSSRPLSQNRMMSMRRFGPLTSLPSNSQASSLLSGLGPRSALGRSANLGRMSQLSSNLARTPQTLNRVTQPLFTSTLGRSSPSLTSSLSRNLASGPRTSRTMVYQPASGTQIVGQRRGTGRITSI